jgi:hypothetical protein
MIEDETEEIFGFLEAECQACDTFTQLGDNGLCRHCAGKLDRDLVRERDWDCSALAFGLSDTQREQLRTEIVTQYGGQLELIVPSPRRP